MTIQTIKTATASDEEAVMAIVVLAFSADPAARWAYSDPQQYLTHFPSSNSLNQPLATSPATNCTFTQGYWKNHGSGACLNGSGINAWPVTSLQLGETVVMDTEAMAGSLDV